MFRNHLYILPNNKIKVTPNNCKIDMDQLILKSLQPYSSEEEDAPILRGILHKLQESKKAGPSISRETAIERTTGKEMEIELERVSQQEIQRNKNHVYQLIVGSFRRLDTMFKANLDLLCETPAFKENSPFYVLNQLGIYVINLKYTTDQADYVISKLYPSLLRSEVMLPPKVGYVVCFAASGGKTFRFVVIDMTTFSLLDNSQSFPFPYLLFDLNSHLIRKHKLDESQVEAFFKSRDMLTYNIIIRMYCELENIRSQSYISILDEITYP